MTVFPCLKQKKILDTNYDIKFAHNSRDKIWPLRTLLLLKTEVYRLIFDKRCPTKNIRFSKRQFDPFN